MWTMDKFEEEKKKKKDDKQNYQIQGLQWFSKK